MTQATPTPRRLGPEWAREGDGFWMSFAATAGNVAFARTVVAAFAARLPFTVEEIEDIKLAVSEVVANVVLHAYDPPGGPVWLGARVMDGALEVGVEDRGRGIEDVEWARRPGTSSLGGDHLGIGFSVAQTYMDTLEVDSTPGSGTSVRMIKRPARAAAGEGPEGAAPHGR